MKALKKIKEINEDIFKQLKRSKIWMQNFELHIISDSQIKELTKFSGLFRPRLIINETEYKQLGEAKKSLLENTETVNKIIYSCYSNVNDINLLMDKLEEDFEIYDSIVNKHLRDTETTKPRIDKKNKKVSTKTSTVKEKGINNFPLLFAIVSSIFACASLYYFFILWVGT